MSPVPVDARTTKVVALLAFRRIARFNGTEFANPRGEMHTVVITRCSRFKVRALEQSRDEREKKEPSTEAKHRVIFSEKADKRRDSIEFEWPKDGLNVRLSNDR